MLRSDQIFELAAEASAGATAGFYALRPFIAKPLLKRAIRKARPVVEQFAQNCKEVCLARTSERQWLILDNFLSTIRQSEEIRADAGKTIAEMKVPEPDKPHSLSHLQKELDGIKVNIGKMIKNNLLNKLKDTVKEETKDRMFKTAAELAHKSRHLDPIKHTIVVVLDKAHLFDHTAKCGEKIVDAAPTELLDFADIITDWITPGTWDVGKSLFKEGKMLSEGKSDPADVFLNGVVPMVARSNLMIVGFLLDVGTGGASCGLFTFLANVAGKKTQNHFYKTAIEDNLAIIKPYLEKIQASKNGAIAKISSAVVENFKTFPQLVDELPSLDQEVTLHSLTTQIVKNYDQDTVAASYRVKVAHLEAVAALPPRSWTDWLFGIDRNKAVADLYLAAATEITGQFSAINNEMACAAKTSPAQMIYLMMYKPVFRDGQTMQTIEALPDRVKKIAESYSQSIQNWRIRCEEAWKKGNANVDAVAKEENAAVAQVAKQFEQEMAVPRQNIRANLRRLGKDPNLCP